MKNEWLEGWLHAVAQEPLPLSPANLNARVWHQIRARQFRPFSPAALAAWLAGAWNQWTLGYAAIVVAVFIGVAIGRLSPQSLTDSSVHFSNQTGESLGLGVFSAHPPAMPSTLLADQP